MEHLWAESDAEETVGNRIARPPPFLPGADLDYGQQVWRQHSEGCGAGRPCGRGDKAWPPPHSPRREDVVSLPSFHQQRFCPQGTEPLGNRGVVGWAGRMALNKQMSICFTLSWAPSFRKVAAFSQDPESAQTHTAIVSHSTLTSYWRATEISSLLRGRPPSPEKAGLLTHHTAFLRAYLLLPLPSSLWNYNMPMPRWFTLPECFHQLVWVSKACGMLKGYNSDFFLGWWVTGSREE